MCARVLMFWVRRRICARVWVFVYVISIFSVCVCLILQDLIPPTPQSLPEAAPDSAISHGRPFQFRESIGREGGKLGVVGVSSHQAAAAAGPFT